MLLLITQYSNKSMRIYIKHEVLVKITNREYNIKCNTNLKHYYNTNYYS